MVAGMRVAPVAAVQTWAVRTASGSTSESAAWMSSAIALSSWPDAVPLCWSPAATWRSEERRVGKEGGSGWALEPGKDAAVLSEAGDVVVAATRGRQRWVLH